MARRPRPLPTTLSRFAREETGNLTMEFMLWLPILLFWFVVSAVFYDAYKSRDAAVKASFTIGDIVSRSTDLDINTVENLVALQRALLPRAGRTMSMRISSIRCDKVGGCDDLEAATSGDYVVAWSIVPDQPGWPDGWTGKPLPLSSSSDVPVEIMPQLEKDAEFVLLEVNVPFTPFADWVGIEADEWALRVQVWPRFVPAIDLTPEAVTKYITNGDGYTS